MPGTENLLHALPTLHGSYECRHVADDWSRFFTNLLYPNRMPLGFFTASSSGESMTLSPVTLAQYYPYKIPIFDAIQPISEAVTLYLPQLFFCKRPSNCALAPILNVTASYIAPSVKLPNGTDY